MNVKKMTTEELREVIEEATGRSFTMNTAEYEFVEACRKELMRRWGIKQ